MTGHLHLVAAAGAAGRTYLREQSCRAPMHLGKGHWDAGTLLVQPVNATAGLFAGDSVTWDIGVEPGARLRLLSPSASRVHRARRSTESGAGAAAEARVEQRFAVARGGSLEVWPELLIPHAGSRSAQRTHIQVEPGAELLFWELLAPGRVASGEAFAFGSLQWALDLYSGPHLIARERWRMAEDDPASFAGWRGAAGPAPAYATAFLISPRWTAASAAWAAIHDLQERYAEMDDTLRIGVSALAAEGWMIRFLAADGVMLRRVVAAIRHELFCAHPG